MAGEYPAAHAATKADAVKIGRERGMHLTHVILRERVYPFRTIRRYTVS